MPLSNFAPRGFGFLGHVETARVLLEAGADRSKPDSDGRTPLAAARANNHHATAFALSSKRARDEEEDLSSKRARDEEEESAVKTPVTESAVETPVTCITS